MLIRLIQEHAEEQFLEALESQEGKSVNRSVLFCAFSHVQLNSDPDDVLPFLKDILRDQDAELYWCRDSDMAVCWRGSSKKILEAIIAALTARYKTKLEAVDPSRIFQFFDVHTQGEELRLLFRKKLEHPQKLTEEPKQETISPPPQDVSPPRCQIAFTDEELRMLQKVRTQRAFRREPEILIVEDQDFSRKLLAGMFERSYRCHMAKNAQEAVHLYAEHAPDVTFLDIELPDADGHQLATLFKKHDNESYVVMVTGNNYVKDVETAKANRVQGFIVKPYNKQKIMSAVEAFMNSRSKR